MQILQKAVMPGREQSWIAGDDLLCGFVVRAADAAWAKTPRQLFEVHGLGFPGSPFSPDSTAVDVLRFSAAPFGRAVDATGAPSNAEMTPIGNGFVDHPPFTGNGFAAVSEQHFVPVWWLEPMRVPAGSELWRIHADGREELISTYSNVASGWQPSPPPRLAPSDIFGTFTEWNGQQVMADVLQNGRIVLASATQHDGWHLTERGLWATTVDASAAPPVYTLRLTATWRGMPFHIVRRWQEESGVVARGVYLGRDSRVAEAAGLQKMDAAVYEANIPMTELENLEGVQLTPATTQP